MRNGDAKKVNSTRFLLLVAIFCNRDRFLHGDISGFLVLTQALKRGNMNKPIICSFRKRYFAQQGLLYPMAAFHHGSWEVLHGRGFCVQVCEAAIKIFCFFMPKPVPALPAYFIPLLLL